MRKIMVAAAALVLMSAGAVAAMSPVAADEVWVQGFQRSGPDAVCQAPADETPWQDSFRGQREWTPSWAQWANNGTGGWVCQREIVWAKSGSTPGMCISIGRDGWVLFDSSGAAPIGAPRYGDAACTTPSGPALETALVAAVDEPQALTACGTLYELPRVSLFESPIWFCRAAS